MAVLRFLTAPIRKLRNNAPLVMVVEMKGAIGADARPGRGLSLMAVDGSLKKAFRRKKAKAVVLAINSPGGAPAQARMIMERARQLSIEKQIPLLSYIEDVGASGGYLIALAGEEIIADPFAIVGSIGVVAASFGFQDAIAKLGIERRVHTAGSNKVRLDPFREEKPEDRAKLEAILEETHRLFIELVKTRRGDRITGDPEVVFSGDFFLAEEGRRLGLVDEVGDLRVILKERYGADLRTKWIAAGRGGLVGLLGGDLAAGAVSALLARIEDREARGRLGR
jgi:signal peptide peptidase SppA